MSGRRTVTFGTRVGPFLRRFAFPRVILASFRRTMMKSYREGGQVSLGSLLLILSLAAAVLYPSRSAHAEDIEIGSSNTETINFAVYNTTTGSNGTPMFSNGMLISAGSQAFPVLGSVNGTAQNFSQTNGDAYTTILSANDN